MAEYIVKEAAYPLATRQEIVGELVRCKDCKHRIEHKHYGDLGESAYTCEGNMVGWILPDDFCSHAKRKNGGAV